MTSRDVQFGPCVATSLLVWLLAPAELFPDLGAVSPCTTRVVPLVEADFQAHPKHRGSDSDSLKVLVTAKGWEQSRHPGTRRYWYVFLPEGYGFREHLFSAASRPRRVFKLSGSGDDPRQWSTP